MPPFLSFHAIAAHRGDGLIPEFVSLFRRRSAIENSLGRVVDLDSYRVPEKTRAGAEKSEARLEYPSKDFSIDHDYG